MDVQQSLNIILSHSPKERLISILRARYTRIYAAAMTTTIGWLAQLTDMGPITQENNQPNRW